MMKLTVYFYVLCYVCTQSTIVLGMNPTTLIELRNHYDNMRAEWYNTNKYPRENCTQKELDYFKSCSSDHTVDDSDDYYQVDPDMAPKAVRSDGKCERKDFRQVNLTEWNRYREALSKMYDTIVDQRSQYQTFAAQHRSSAAPGAHYGPGFLCWHRFYLRSFERGLQTHDSGLCLLFADWRLDYPLPNPCHSVMFSPDYLDRSNGTLAGFWSKWRGYSPGCEGTIYRQCIDSRNDYLISDSDVSSLLSKYSQYGDWCYPNNPDYEYTHGGPHVMISGTMNNLNCAVNDPVFWFHHCSIDYYWNMGRNAEANRPNNYPTWTNVPPEHQANAPCNPFPSVANKDGLSNEFDDGIIYVDARKPCQTDANCSQNGDRAALWCYNGQCCSKIRKGGQCGTLPNNACHKESTCADTTTARCVSGTCVCN